jgi:DNA-binding CsgD family transcriptional regulator
VTRRGLGSWICLDCGHETRFHRIIDGEMRCWKSCPCKRPHVALSVREIELLKLIAGGRTMKSIAEEWKLSVKTVEAHRYSLGRKTGLHNVSALVAFAK